jgi:hypothetical protein
MQIFAYSEHPEFQALLEVECKEISGARPLIRTTFEEINGLFNIFQTIDILILDYPEDNELKNQFLNFIKRSEGRIKKLFILGEADIEADYVQTFSRIEISELFESLRIHFNPELVPVFGWSAIPLCTLVHFEILPFDLYLKLSDSRYVKRIPAYEKVDIELTESLKAKGITDLFCEKKNNREFSMMLINNMINKMEKNYPSQIDKSESHDEVLSTTREIIQHLGLSSRVVEVCESAIETMCLDVLAEPNVFSGHLLNLKNNKNLSFQYKLISLTNYIGTQLITDMDMPKKDEQIKKLIFASFFCDISLKNPGFIYHRKSEDTSGISMKEENEVNFHALNASELVATYKHTPKEVSLIIRQHHGSFSGIGFPVTKSAELLPLSKILLISQDLAFAILADENAPVIDVLKQFLRRTFCSGLKELLIHLEDSLAKSA